MKKLLIVALMMCSPVMATESETVSNESFCKSIHGLAGTIMKNRQKLTPTPDVMALVKVSEPLNGLVVDMVIDAYSRQDYSSDSMQQKSIAAFANDYYLSCIKELSK